MYVSDRFEMPMRRATPRKPADETLSPTNGAIARAMRREYAEQPIGEYEEHSTPTGTFVQVRITQVAHRDPTADRAIRNI